MNSNRLTPLDSLRGIAAIGVAFFGIINTSNLRMDFLLAIKGIGFITMDGIW